MSEAVVSVSDAAKDFLRVLEQVETSRQPTVLTRDGRPVAELVPLPPHQPTPATREGLIEKWKSIHRLPPDEAESFARDLESIHGDQPSLKSAWD